MGEGEGGEGGSQGDRGFPKASSKERLAPGASGSSYSIVAFPFLAMTGDPLHTTCIPHSISFNLVCCR